MEMHKPKRNMGPISNQTTTAKWLQIIKSFVLKIKKRKIEWAEDNTVLPVKDKIKEKTRDTT